MTKPSVLGVVSIHSSRWTMLSRGSAVATLAIPRKCTVSPVRSFLTLLEQRPQEIRLRRTLALPAPHMLRVVSEVDRYAEFVPYCQGCVVTERNLNGDPLKARMLVGWQNLTEEFDSLVHCDANRGVVTSEAADSKIFSTLFSQWTIREVPGGRCGVELILKFQFQSALYNSVTTTFGPKLARKMVEAFSHRARKTYEHSKI